MSRQKLQLLMATFQEIPDRLNVRCCSMCALSCLNFEKVPELYGFVGPMQWCGAQGTHPGEASVATSSMARVMLGHLTMCEHIPELCQGPYLKLALSVATSPPPKLPRIQNKSLFLSFSKSLATGWPGPVSQKLQFTWAFWSSAGLSIHFP